ncbi:hypothetical protein LOZ66_006003 [Ophidiomyces ophidiicola]|nr:hypothetical protein LOZ66_006003 [Ophidiomyces ophidiicola]
MAPSTADWTNIRDMSERRKAQNRVAQKNYRTRQKQRMELAEAILMEMPHLRPAATIIAQKKGRRPIAHSLDDRREISPVESDGGAETLHSGNSCAGSGQSSSPDASQTTTATPCQVEQNTNIGHSYNLQLWHGHPISNHECIDPTLDRTDWIHLQVAQSPPSRLGPKLDDHFMGVSSPSRHQELGREADSTIIEPDSTQILGSWSPPYCLTPCSVGHPASAAFHAATPLPHGDPGNFTVNHVFDGSGTAIGSLKSPVLTAISRGNLQIARLLVHSGAQLDVPDHSGYTPLQLAVQEGDLSAARVLLDLGADVSVTDARGRGLLHLAVEGDKREMAKMLLEWCERQNTHPMSPSHSCRGDGEEPREVRSLVQWCLNIQDQQKLTAVHLCVLLERVEMLKTLLEYGADVNIGCG